MLAKLQKQFCEAVIAGKPESDLQQSLAKHYSEEEAQARLAIYQNNFYASLFEHLFDTFPTVVKLLGDEFFRALSREFIRANPPTSPCIDLYGEHFSSFIAHFPPLTDYPYIADIAKLNYCQHSIWYAEEKTSLRAEDFAAFDIPGLSSAKITLNPSLVLIHSPFAIYSIWEENEKEVAGEVQASQSETLMVFRELPEYSIHTQLIDVAYFTFLQKLKDQLTLAQALEAASEIDASFNASSAINSLIRSGLTTDILPQKND